MKKCSQCGKSKPLEEFGKRASAPDGRRGVCKECNAPAARAACAKWERQNPEKKQAYKEANRDVYRQSHKRWRDANIESERQRFREYRRTNPGLFREHQQRRRALAAGAPGIFSDAEWQRLLTLLGDWCLSCGSDDVTIDHIVPLSKGGSNWIWNLQPLCGSCNSSKRNSYEDFRYSIYSRLYEGASQGCP